MVRFQVRAPAELGLVAFCNVHALIAQQILFSGQHLETVALPRRRLPYLYRTFRMKFENMQSNTFMTNNAFAMF
ncbi:hypothetical protein T06_13968 [Trichinella sp. T6]|nr:hypothetical protein T06_13968 [Trichinella sp. T6]